MGNPLQYVKDANIHNRISNVADQEM